MIPKKISTFDQRTKNEDKLDEKNFEIIFLKKISADT